MHAQDTSRLYLGYENPNLIINKQGIELKFNFDMGAKGLSNATMLDFRQKNSISDERKKNILKQLYPSSHFGYDLNTSLAYQFKIKHNRYIWFELGARSHAHAFLRKNLIELALNGNSYYAGKDIDLEGNRYTGVSWQYITTGFTLKQKKIIYNMGLSLLSGYRNTHVNVASGNFYTDVDGEYINVRLDAQAQQSKPYPTTLIKTAGIGTSMSFDLFIPKKNYTVQMGFKDLGFIKWVNNAQVTTVDTNIHFEGIILNDFNQIATAAARTRLSDSLKALPSSFNQSQSYIQLLPSYVYAKYTQKWGTDMVSASIEYIYLAYPVPKASFTYFRIKKQHSFNTQLVIGGYNQYDINFGYSLNHKKFNLQLMLKSLRGYIAPQVFSGAGLYLNLSKSI